MIDDVLRKSEFPFIYQFIPSFAQFIRNKYHSFFAELERLSFKLPSALSQ